MSLLGIDVGTTACKVAAFSPEGGLVASAAIEYDVQRRQPDWAELDAAALLPRIKAAICQVASRCSKDPVSALAVSSMGEAVVPVTRDREILAPSILNFDPRGDEYVEQFRTLLDDERLYQVNGNWLGKHYGLTKLKWLQENIAGVFAAADHLLLWSPFVSFMLGADAVVDHSLANRTLLFDLERADWSGELLAATGLDRSKLPAPVPSGTPIGRVLPRVAKELGLGANVTIVSGAHDQCANAVGCGVIAPGRAVYGMGTFICITPVFTERREPRLMIERALNTEHHAAPGRYVSFIYNQGGSTVKWFRDTFASLERQMAEREGEDIYDALFAELPAGPSPALALTDFVDRPFGTLVGLKLTTTRAEILKAIVEGTTFDLKLRVDSLGPTGIEIDEFRAAGGGSKSDAWVQLAADITGRPFVRTGRADAGALGAAILAGVGSGVFSSVEEGVEAMVRTGDRFEPDTARHSEYEERLDEYRRLKESRQE